MEHVRLIIAIVLSLLVFVVWDFLFVDRQPQAPPETPSGISEKQSVPEKGGSPEAEAPPIPARPFKGITVETRLYTVKISERGAAIEKFVLKNYNENPGSDSPLKSLIPESNTAGTALVSLGGDAGNKEEPFTTDFSGNVLQVGGKTESLSFFRKTPEGLVLEKRYLFHPDSYRIDMKVSLSNQSSQPVNPELQLTMTNPPDEARSDFFQGPLAYIDGELKQIKPKDIEKKDTYSGMVEWAGFEDHYFMSVLVPPNPVKSTVRFNNDAKHNLIHVTYTQPAASIAPGSRQQYDYSLFFGPKQMNLLSAMGHNLDKAVDFGWFDIIAKPCLWLMIYIHDHVIANYGVAIILLTIIFKILFWPLGNKSYRSMAEMKKLQPLMADIRKRYKDDRQKMNEEVMRLYKTYKVNPMSGCLPMVVQIPVFIAFYRMLYQAIELRHAPFMLWINDLSSPDRLFHFSFSIPFMTPPYGIPVLTIIMGATMFIQQKLSPPPGDPSQAKIMMMMPLIFTVIFINFPAGLVLYWLVNNVFSIAQQYYITRKTV